MNLVDYITPAIAGLLSGAIGSLVAPWVNWGIESKRERMKARRALVEEARSLLHDPPPLADFRKLPLYFKLKPLLSAKTNKILAGAFTENGSETTILVAGGPHGGINPYAHEVLADVTHLERKWGLL